MAVRLFSRNKQNRHSKGPAGEPTIDQMKSSLAAQMPPGMFGNHSAMFYAQDSHIPPGYTAHTLTARLREAGLVPVQNEYTTLLSVNSSQIEAALPPYLKISTLYFEERAVYAVTPSSKFLDLTSYAGTNFLFRGEKKESPAETANLILKRLESGRMVHDRDTAIHATPQLGAAFGYANQETGCLWLIRTSAMDAYPIDIQNRGWEILFPKIDSPYLAACVTSSQVISAMRASEKIPENFLYSFDTVNLDELIERFSVK